MHLLLCLIVRI